MHRLPNILQIDEEIGVDIRSILLNVRNDLIGARNRLENKLSEEGLSMYKSIRDLEILINRIED